MRRTWARRGLMKVSLTVGAAALVAAPRIIHAVEQP